MDGELKLELELELELCWERTLASASEIFSQVKLGVVFDDDDDVRGERLILIAWEVGMRRKSSGRFFGTWSLGWGGGVGEGL